MLKKKQDMRIGIESQADVIDFVSRGLLPPMKKDFNDLVDAIENRQIDNVNGDPIDPSRRIVVKPGIEFTMDDDALINAMRRVYKNRCRNRNIAMGVLAVTGTIAVASMIRSHNKIDELEDKNEQLVHIIEEDLPTVDLTCF
ncbi:MAG: hypothetical protein NC548_12860 [Lachnospiraceae bacterium]|nr:hypothetical protein [Lachnospiraceae bacterium]MCM1230719.1 hypothetical protein [Ruminococcus flavefaciens]